MDTNECYVYFAFTGDDFDPNDITRMLELEPTSTMLKGSKIPNNIPKCNAWHLSTDRVVNEVIDVEKMVLQLTEKLRPKTKLINEVKKRYDAVTHLEVVMWVTTDEKQSAPSVGFSVDVMEFLVEVGAFIDMDIYRK